MLNKVELDIIPEEQRDAALEHYMKRCFQLEQENQILREEVRRLYLTLDSIE
jgi:prefoldin subunit 5